MKFIDVDKTEEDDSLLRQPVIDVSDYLEVRPETCLRVAGEPALIYGRLDEDFSDVKAICKVTKYSRYARISQKTKVDGKFTTNPAVKTTDVRFGFRPRDPLKGNAAGLTEWSAKNPEWHQAVARLGVYMTKKYRFFSPERYKRHCAAVKKNIEPQWIIDGTPFNQGVINSSNALYYHYDRDNFDDCWSCMVYFVKGIKGGELLVPSMKIKLVPEDSTYVLFDGQSLIHGVAPIKPLSTRAYRYSLVYYSRKAMIGLGSVEEELEKSKTTEMTKHMKKLEVQ